MPDVRPSVSFIGLGAMGFPMAARLAGVARLTVFDADPDTLARVGGIGTPVSSVAAAVAAADVVITMLPADAHVLEVGEQIIRHGRPGQLYIDLSTVHPRVMQSLRDRAGDGPEVLSGSCMKAVAAAVIGDLTLFVGGAASGLDRIRPLLDAMASRVIDVGDIAAPKSLKIINNLVVAGLNLAVAEATVIAGRAGIGRREFLESLAAAGIGGWPLHHQILKYSAEGSFPTGLFGVRYMAKDVALASRLCDDHAVARFLCGPISATFRGAAALGRAEHYHPVILEWLQHAAGSPTPSTPPAGPTDARATADGADVLPVLLASTLAMEQLTCAHGLAVAAATGVTITDAARHLGAASAASGTMAAVADGTISSLATTVAATADPVAAGIGVAARCDVPAFALEAAHDYLRGPAAGE